MPFVIVTIVLLAAIAVAAIAFRPTPTPDVKLSPLAHKAAWLLQRGLDDPTFRQSPEWEQEAEAIITTYKEATQ